MRVYRLVKAKYAQSAWDGAGAKAYGGRWNSKGRPMVYASASIALAALELLVHLQRNEILNYYLLCRLDLPDSEVMTLGDGALPSDWRASQPPSSTAFIGDEWVASGKSLALAVPSVLVSQEYNYLINPAHPMFGEALRTAAQEPFEFDARLAGRR